MRTKIASITKYNGRLKKLPLIEGLRAFAVIAVVANHLGPRRMSSGYLGVDIFFVISSFVITKSLQANVGDSQWLFYSRFFTKRVARILPALFTCIGSAILLVAMFASEKLNVITTIVAVLAAFFCVLFPSPASGITTVLANRVALWIGEQSYSSHLWQWVILTTAK